MSTRRLRWLCLAACLPQVAGCVDLATETVVRIGVTTLFSPINAALASLVSGISA